MKNTGNELHYWQEGTKIISDQLAEAVREFDGDNWYSYAPIGMSSDGARGWLAGRIDAMRHSLEMMGYIA